MKHIISSTVSFFCPSENASTNLTRKSVRKPNIMYANTGSRASIPVGPVIKFSICLFMKAPVCRFSRERATSSLSVQFYKVVAIPGGDVTYFHFFSPSAHKVKAHVVVTWLYACCQHKHTADKKYLNHKSTQKNSRQELNLLPAD